VIATLSGRAGDVERSAVDLWWSADDVLAAWTG